MSKNHEIARLNLDIKFEEIKKTNVFIRPPKGWIRAIWYGYIRLRMAMVGIQG